MITFFKYIGVMFIILLIIAIVIMKKELDSDIKRNALMRYIVSKMNFRNYFGSFHLMVGKNETKICCYDPDMNIIDETVLWKKCPLTPGVYKIFCYNYVVLAASEY